MKTQEEKVSHTPIPWFANASPFHPFEVVERSGVVLAVTYPRSATRESAAREAEANAQFIVRCVNSHQDLLDACRAIEDLLSRINTAFYVDGSTKALRPVMAETKPILGTLREAIAKATQP